MHWVVKLVSITNCTSSFYLIPSEENIIHLNRNVNIRISFESIRIIFLLSVQFPTWPDHCLLWHFSFHTSPLIHVTSATLGSERLENVIADDTIMSAHPTSEIKWRISLDLKIIIYSLNRTSVFSLREKMLVLFKE